jgi:tRNA-Thr(GGU) m(6)t(6)A37 methyltransferase TsaA
VNPIGRIRSGFTAKFGVPRQASLIDEAVGILKLDPDPRFIEATRDLELFSHVWVIFLFDRNDEGDWRPTIQLPRLEVGHKVGVFASRSPHRPNRIGMSAARLGAIDRKAPGGIEIILHGVDILDGSSVLDLKPYVPYADAIPDARGAWTEPPIRKFSVTLDPGHASVIHESGSRNLHRFRGDPVGFVMKTLELDPRPTSQREAMPIDDPLQEGRRFAFRVLDLDIHWEIRSGGIRVVEVLLTGIDDPMST